MTEIPTITRYERDDILTAAICAARQVAINDSGGFIHPSDVGLQPENSAARRAADEVVAACLSAIAMLNRCNASS